MEQQHHHPSWSWKAQDVNSTAPESLVRNTEVWYLDKAQAGAQDALSDSSQQAAQCINKIHRTHKKKTHRKDMSSQLWYSIGLVTKQRSQPLHPRYRSGYSRWKPKLLILGHVHFSINGRITIMDRHRKRRTDNSYSRRTRGNSRKQGIRRVPSRQILCLRKKGHSDFVTGETGGRWRSWGAVGQDVMVRLEQDRFGLKCGENRSKFWGTTGG